MRYFKILSLLLILFLAIFCTRNIKTKEVAGSPYYSDMNGGGSSDLKEDVKESEEENKDASEVEVQDICEEEAGETLPGDTVDFDSFDVLDFKSDQVFVEDTKKDLKKEVEVEEEVIPDQVIDVPDLCSQEGEPLNIYDLQNPMCPKHPAPEPTNIEQGVDVTLNNKIVTGVYGDSFFIQEPKGGPYSGIFVFAHKKPVNIKVGDLVNVTGKYYEFFKTSQIWLNKYEVIDHGFQVQPFVIEHPSFIATGGKFSEMFEGVLVRVNDVIVVNTKPDCPYEFGEFMLNGGLRVDDMGDITYKPTIFDKLQYVIGPLHFTFGNFKLEPRTDDDMPLKEKGTGAYTKCINTDCIEPVDAPETNTLIITEVMYDPFGTDENFEYFEVYNNTDKDIKLNGYTVKDCAVQSFQVTGENDIIVKAHSFFVFARSKNFKKGDYYYPSDFYLPNTEGAILIYDENGQLVDQMRYAAFDPWKFKTGHSIELVSLDVDNMVPAHWDIATEKIEGSDNYGTPGWGNY